MKLTKEQLTILKGGGGPKQKAALLDWSTSRVAMALWALRAIGALPPSAHSYGRSKLPVTKKISAKTGRRRQCSLPASALKHIGVAKHGEEVLFEAAGPGVVTIRKAGQ